MNASIAVVGAGNLGVAFAKGLLKSRYCHPGQLILTRRNVKSLESLRSLGMTLLSDNSLAVASTDVIVLAVKPFQVAEVINEIRDQLIPERHILISLATGISIEALLEMSGKEIPIVRAMPNTATHICQSMTCMCAKNLSSEQRNFVADLFNHLGTSVFIEEGLMNAATVLGACGTAFAMRFIRANIQGGIELGFDAETAALIAAQTIKGAAELLITNNSHPEQEIDKVTTPKGCTITGLNEMEHHGLSSSVIRGVLASYRKLQSP